VILHATTRAAANLIKAHPLGLLWTLILALYPLDWWLWWARLEAGGVVVALFAVGFTVLMAWAAEERREARNVAEVGRWPHKSDNELLSDDPADWVAFGEQRAMEEFS
jgi:hypothetical protein